MLKTTFVSIHKFYLRLHAKQDIYANNSQLLFQLLITSDNTIIGMESLGEDQMATRMVWKNAGYSLLSWLVIYLCVAFGLKATGRITYFTMGLPVILLFVFLGRAVSLPGAQLGTQEYIKDTNWDVLSDGVVWSKAVSQIFFSLSITVSKHVICLC